MQSLFGTNIDFERFVDYGGSAETTSRSSDGGDTVSQGTDAFYPWAQYQDPFSVGSTEAVQKDNCGSNAPLSLSLSLSHRTDWLASLEPFPNFLGEPSAVVEVPDDQKQNDPMHGQAKLQCWDHGCDGREFSSKSNLIRHRKERSSRIAKCACPLCGAVFTRSSARDTHLARQSCGRIRRYSNGRPRPSQLALLGNPELVNSLQDTQW